MYLSLAVIFLRRVRTLALEGHNFFVATRSAAQTNSTSPGENWKWKNTACAAVHGFIGRETRTSRSRPQLLPRMKKKSCERKTINRAGTIFLIGKHPSGAWPCGFMLPEVSEYSGYKASGTSDAFNVLSFRTLQASTHGHVALVTLIIKLFWHECYCEVCVAISSLILLIQV